MVISLRLKRDIFYRDIDETHALIIEKIKSIILNLF